MKALSLKNIFYFVFCLFACNTQGQQLDLLKEKSLTVFGFDFSSAKMIGPEGFNDPRDIKERKIDNWNQQFKYDLKGLAFAFGSQNKHVEYDVLPVKSINAAIDYQDLVLYNPKDFVELKTDSLQSHIQRLKTENRQGLGVLYVVDYFSKKEKIAQVYAVFFDIENKTILMQNPVYGEPDGFGFSDYWGIALKSIVSKSSLFYNDWAKKEMKRKKKLNSK